MHVPTCTGAKVEPRRIGFTTVQAKNRGGPIARSRLLSALLEERKIPGFPESGWDGAVYYFTSELRIKVEDYQKGTKTVPLKELVESMEKHFRLKHRMTELGVAVDEHVKETRADRKDKAYMLLDVSQVDRYSGLRYGSPSFDATSTRFEKRYPEISK